MSHCVVPDWHLPREGQEKLQGEEGHRRSDMHKQLQNNPSTQPVAMSNYGVAELTWANGQLAMHGLGGVLHSGQTKPTWGRTGETLESVVHQATRYRQKPNIQQQQEAQDPANLGSIVPPSEGKWAHQMGHLVMKKRTRSESNQHTGGFHGSTQDEQVNRSACASASAFSEDNDMDISTRSTWTSFESPRSLINKTTAEDSVNFCIDNDTTMMTWPSFQSSRSLKTKSTDEDSACQDGSENQDEDNRETKTETVRSHSTSRRSRAAAVHNQSERRRRDRINQKMKALQKLVPNASKTDKASMLDEVIDYLKKLQAQVQMMSVGNMPQMMMPLGMQQQLQMSLLARMGMGVGLGMGMGVLDMSTMASSAQHSLPQLIHPSPPVTAAKPAFVSAPFVVPQMMTGHSATRTNPDPANSNLVRMPDPYCAYFAQSMNMELYNKMAALYQHQVSQGTQPSSSPSQTKHLQAD